MYFQDIEITLWAPLVLNVLRKYSDPPPTAIQTIHRSSLGAFEACCYYDCDRMVDFHVLRKPSYCFLHTYKYRSTEEDVVNSVLKFEFIRILWLFEISRIYNTSFFFSFFFSRNFFLLQFSLPAYFPILVQTLHKSSTHHYLGSLFPFLEFSNIWFLSDHRKQLHAGRIQTQA